MTQTLKKAKLRHAEYYGLQETFDDLYAKSKRGETFGHLMEIVASDQNIMLAYRNIKGNKGSHTAGTDGRDIGHLAEMSKEEFLSHVRGQFANYQPKAVRRVEIPKPNGKMRPLGIPCITDRIVQQCVLQVLEPICEAKFYDRSHGFRPDHSTENAMADCYRLMQVSNLHYVVDVDIEGFFDNVNHRKLMQQLWTLGVRDTKLLAIIKAMLKAPIRMPDGGTVHPEKGTPQGGVLSPLLANVVLNEFDWWIVSQWEGQTERLRKPPKKQYNQKGTRVMSNEYKALRSTRLKEMYIVRYADDAKIFCRNREDAERTYEAVCGWLQARLKLNVSPEKSKVTNLKKQYCEFLGFKMKVVPRGKESDGTPRYVVRSHVCDKALERIKETLRDRLDQIQRPRDSRDLHLRVNVYNAIVIGIQNYYSMATMVSDDLNGINRIVQGRINRRIATDRKGHWPNDYLKKRYGKSRMMRWVSGTPILPIGYVRHMHPMPKPKEVNAYTPEGRRAIHENLGMDASVMLNMMRNPIRERTIEYNDNRISLYVAQQGRCAVTGIGLEMGEIHCHHKKPTAMGGSDRYQNLVILHKDVHVLVHANADETIARYAGELNLTERQLGKVNKLRAEAGLKPIEYGMSVSSE